MHKKINQLIKVVFPLVRPRHGLHSALTTDRHQKPLIHHKILMPEISKTFARSPGALKTCLGRIRQRWQLALATVGREGGVCALVVILGRQMIDKKKKQVKWLK